MLKNLVLLCLIVSSSCFAQSDSIAIRFLKAKLIDSTSGKDITVFFLVSTKDSAGFPPVITVPPKCTLFENEQEKIVLFNPGNLSVALYGDNVEEKNKEVYELLKNEVDFHPKHPQMIVAYTVKDLYYNFTKMTFTPVFREKQNRNIKIEKKCEFLID